MVEYRQASHTVAPSLVVVVSTSHDRHSCALPGRGKYDPIGQAVCVCVCVCVCACACEWVWGRSVCMLVHKCVLSIVEIRWSASCGVFCYYSPLVHK